MYKAEIKVGDQTKNYIGCTEGEFKTRFNGHKNSFRNEKSKASTTLSSLVWDNNKNPDQEINWSVLGKTNRYRPGMKTCSLCVAEKMFILRAGRDRNNINRRNEVANLCVHKGKFKLANFQKE